MPRLSEFYGIVVYMYFADHNPPHFHAIYGEDEAVVTISDGSVIAGGLPRNASRLVEQWRIERRAELAANWELAQVPTTLKTIEPLQ